MTSLTEKKVTKTLHRKGDKARKCCKPVIRPRLTPRNASEAAMNYDRLLDKMVGESIAVVTQFAEVEYKPPIYIVISVGQIIEWTPDRTIAELTFLKSRSPRVSMWVMDGSFTRKLIKKENHAPPNTIEQQIKEQLPQLRGRRN